MIDYRQIITVEPGKRFGRPCIRGLRITVGDEASCRRVAHIVGRFMADRAAPGRAERTA